MATVTVGIANTALVREGDAPTGPALPGIAHTDAVLVAAARMVHAAAATVNTLVAVTREPPAALLV